MERPTCVTCPFWESLGNANEGPDFHSGRCHRSPKVLSDSMLILLSLYQSGEDGEAYDSPFESTDEAQRVWEECLGMVHDQTCWHYPVHAENDWCGEHPDFPAYIATTRSAPEQRTEE